MSPVVGVIFLAALAAAQKPVLVNDLVDKQLTEHNAVLTKKGLGMMEFSSGTTDGIEFSKGIQLGLNTMKRTGDCFAIKESKESTAYKYQIGYELLLFAFGKIDINGRPMSGYFRVKDNQMQFDYTIHNGTSCSVTMDEYKFTKFDNVVHETTAPLSVGDEPQLNLNDVLLRHVNSVIEQRKIGVERHLQALCKPNGFPIGQLTLADPSLAVTLKPPQ